MEIWSARYKPMISLNNIHKSFGNKNVLNGISAEIPKGEIVFILGKSGVGKSVLLKLLVGLLAVDKGHIVIDNLDVTELNEDALSGIRKKCALIFQFPALLDSVSVAENIALGLKVAGEEWSPSIQEKIIEEKLAAVRLKATTADRMPNTLSFGVQKRVSIARALAMNPQYLLFDEPTTGMDPVVTATLNDLIFSLSRDLNATSIVVSHDLKSARKIADRILLLEEGKIVFDGNPVQFEKSPHPLAAAFRQEGEFDV